MFLCNTRNEALYAQLRCEELGMGRQFVLPRKPFKEEKDDGPEYSGLLLLNVPGGTREVVTAFQEFGIPICLLWPSHAYHSTGFQTLLKHCQHTFDINIVPLVRTHPTQKACPDDHRLWEFFGKAMDCHSLEYIGAPAQVRNAVFSHLQSAFMYMSAVVQWCLDSLVQDSKVDPADFVSTEAPKYHHPVDEEGAALIAPEVAGGPFDVSAGAVGFGGGEGGGNHNLNQTLGAGANIVGAPHHEQQPIQPQQHQEGQQQQPAGLPQAPAAVPVADPAAQGAGLGRVFGQSQVWVKKREGGEQVRKFLSLISNITGTTFDVKPSSEEHPRFEICMVGTLKNRREALLLLQRAIDACAARAAQGPSERIVLCPSPHVRHLIGSGGRQRLVMELETGACIQFEESSRAFFLSDQEGGGERVRRLHVLGTRESLRRGVELVQKRIQNLNDHSPPSSRQRLGQLPGRRGGHLQSEAERPS
uniref:K Homology domain-containing protein n=1 Tax=Chromera velia CCMP2878 TaxID=1169474 RepID=A0A0G4F300_9ALVE|eukprot:Cvel_2674.t1-p1 / transcript=Cvel_2674.t1 / gene=Cvel_2674 / organism=Chromera_velia_CCMP2878 / gene_product=hypothetical protein / transcript_product=hypothetical protein / location=Cvel_scaffold106:128807-133670(+) / protein_length=473 / sequence_SO=supercontig / SO=protein_coding / is_pseudo=false